MARWKSADVSVRAESELPLDDPIGAHEVSLNRRRVYLFGSRHGAYLQWLWHAGGRIETSTGRPLRRISILQFGYRGR